MSGAYLYGFVIGTNAKHKIHCTPEGKLLIDPTLILENPPIEDETKKAATSEWCYDHWKNAAAHHTKYTNLEAQTACKLNGTLYWSCSGLHFNGRYPDTDNVDKDIGGGLTVKANDILLVSHVNLPNGATISGVEVFGNAAASAETWSLRRVKLSDGIYSDIASASVNTEDTSIDNAIVDNSLYGYYFYTSTLDLNDAIYGARITYTI